MIVNNPAPLARTASLDDTMRLAALSARFWSKVDKSAGPDGCWLWTGGHDRYGVFFRDGRLQKSHRVAFELASGGEPLPSDVLVCHSCDTPLCCNPTHLWLGSHADNSRDMYAKGRAGDRWNRGQDHHNAVMDWGRVRELRRVREATGYGYTRLSAMFGIARSTVRQIVTGETWKEGAGA